MKNFIFILAIAGIAFTSCKKETIEPAPQQNNINNGTNTGTNNGTGSPDTLAFEFVVKTEIPSTELDSVVIIHYDIMWAPIDTVTFLPSQIIGLGTNIMFNADMVEVQNDIALTGADAFMMSLYLNTTTDWSGSTQNRYEFGYSDNYNTASNWFGFLYDTDGTGIVRGGQTY